MHQSFQELKEMPILTIVHHFPVHNFWITSSKRIIIILVVPYFLVTGFGNTGVASMCSSRGRCHCCHITLSVLWNIALLCWLVISQAWWHLAHGTQKWFSSDIIVPLVNCFQDPQFAAVKTWGEQVGLYPPNASQVSVWWGLRQCACLSPGVASGALCPAIPLLAILLPCSCSYFCLAKICPQSWVAGHSPVFNDFSRISSNLISHCVQALMHL